MTIPAGHETIVPGEVYTHGLKTFEGIVEPSNRFLAKDNNILVGRTFTKVGKTSSVIPVRVMNLNDNPSTLYKGTHIAVINSALQVGSDETDSEWGVELDDLFERTCMDLNQEQQNKFKELLEKNHDVFSKGGELGRTNVVIIQ